MLSVSASPLTRQEPPKLLNSSTDKYKFHNLVDQQIKLNVKLKTPDDIDLAFRRNKNLSLFLNFFQISLPKTVVFGEKLKKICKYKSPNLPIKNPDGSYVISNPDKAELFKTHLSDIFQPHPDIFSHTNNNKINDHLNSPLCSSAGPINHFTPNDIKFVINQCFLKKSPGYDLITAEVARCLSKRAIVHLTHIFNSILRLFQFPSLWKFSTIILIPKPNKPPDSISSFRPISLLPFFAKILEKLILKRILPSISANSIIPNSQFGFRSAHSIIQVHGVVDAISYSLKKKFYCTCVLLDVSSAFNRVWHEGLLFNKISSSHLLSSYLIITF
ncbi:hypothetical protein QTP88_012551 [Uroleucon formosanum]